MSDIQRLRLKLRYMASTYGIDHLIAAYIEGSEEDDEYYLVLEGSRRSNG